jgi:hypothetical protein
MSLSLLYLIGLVKMRKYGTADKWDLIKLTGVMVIV